MNWDAIGAIGEIVGAVAVIVTLAYLALQMKQNTKALTTSMYESAMGGFNEVIAFHNSDLKWTPIFGPGLKVGK